MECRCYLLPNALRKKTIWQQYVPTKDFGWECDSKFFVGFSQQASCDQGSKGRGGSCMLILQDFIRKCLTHSILQRPDVKSCYHDSYLKVPLPGRDKKEPKKAPKESNNNNTTTTANNNTNTNNTLANSFRLGLTWDSPVFVWYCTAMKYRVPPCISFHS